MCLGQDCECFNCQKAADECSEHYDCEDMIEYGVVCCNAKMDCPDYLPFKGKVLFWLKDTSRGCILLASKARRILKCLSESDTIFLVFGSCFVLLQTTFNSGWVRLRSRSSPIKLCISVGLMECGQ